MSEYSYVDVYLDKKIPYKVYDVQYSRTVSNFVWIYARSLEEAKEIAEKEIGLHDQRVYKSHVSEEYVQNVKEFSGFRNK